MNFTKCSHNLHFFSVLIYKCPLSFDEFLDYLQFFFHSTVCAIRRAQLTTRPKCCQNYCFFSYRLSSHSIVCSLSLFDGSLFALLPQLHDYTLFLPFEKVNSSQRECENVSILCVTIVSEFHIIFTVIWAFGPHFRTNLWPTSWQWVKCRQRHLCANIWSIVQRLWW